MINLQDSADHQRRRSQLWVDVLLTSLRWVDLRTETWEGCVQAADIAVEDFDKRFPPPAVYIDNNIQSI